VAAHEVQYLHPDHLGSIGPDASARQSITSQTGAWVQDVYFHPYGGIRWSRDGGNAIGPNALTRRTYTGQYDIGFWAGAIQHYNARQYDYVLGRFLQPDTMTADPGNPYDLNRYMYVRGNPTNLNDPTGHCPMCIGAGIGALIGAAIVGGIYAYNNYGTGSFDSGELLVAMGTGALAGGLIGSGVGAVYGAQLAGAALAGTAATAATTAINAGAGAGGAALAYTAFSGTDYNSGDAIVNTAGGAATGVVSGGIPYGSAATVLARTGAYAGIGTAQYAASTALVHGENLTWEGAGVSAAGGALGGVVDSATGGLVSGALRPTRPFTVAPGTQLVDPELWVASVQASNRRGVFWGAVSLMSGTAGSVGGTELTKWMQPAE
jgi:RHS repeat-associated protein